MRTLRANIPSDKEYFVNENGEVLSPYGKLLKGKPNPNSKTLRSLDYLNTDGKRKAISIQKLMWQTFYPNDLPSKDEIIVVKNQDHPFPFALENLVKLSRKEMVHNMNEKRFLKINARKNKEQ